jgi:hypothetical protein
MRFVDKDKTVEGFDNREDYWSGTSRSAAVLQSHCQLSLYMTDADIAKAGYTGFRISPDGALTVMPPGGGIIAADRGSSATRPLPVQTPGL